MLVTAPGGAGGRLVDGVGDRVAWDFGSLGFLGRPTCQCGWRVNRRSRHRCSSPMPVPVYPMDRYLLPRLYPRAENKEYTHLY